MKKEITRKIEILVLSDLHLGTYGCQAKALLKYMKSIDPEEIILNGDIIDFWQFSKKYFPKSHLKVINQLVKWLSKGKKIHYITGNHDEFLRKFDGTVLGGLEIKNQLFLDIDGHKHWFFHGDVFDFTMQHSKWLVRIGGIGYNGLILLNQGINAIRNLFGFERVSISKSIKNKVKRAVAFINSFEETVALYAIKKQVSKVVCGHIHQPCIKKIKTKNKTIVYLNSGDWIENLTALEYVDCNWTIYQHSLNDIDTKPEIVQEKIDKSPRELFSEMHHQLIIMNA